MNRPAYLKLLTPAERSASMKIGAAMKYAEFGVKQSALTDVLSPDNAMKAIVAVSLLGGIPMGVAAHIVGRRLTGTENREQELKEKIKYYRNATRGLETGLSAPAAQPDTTDTSAT